MSQSTGEDLRIECGNCDWKGTESQAEEAQDLWQRIDPGSEVPAGECPKCGALVYVVEEENIYATEVRQLKARCRNLIEALKGLASWDVGGIDEDPSGFEADQANALTLCKKKRGAK